MFKKNTNEVQKKMKTIPVLLTLLISFALNSVVFADSPLTSTDFSSVYQNEPIIVLSSKTKGLLTDELMDYLTQENNPVEIKMALINKIGWNIQGGRIQQNS
jgi:hypothetical protein